MVEPIKKRREPEWHILKAWFTREDGMEPASVDGVPVLIPGKLGDVPVIQIPASATPEVFDRISKAVIEACGVEPFIITSNVQVLRFEKITDREAKALMAKTRDGLKRVEDERERLQAAEAAPAVDDQDRDGDGSVADGLGDGDALADEPEGSTDDGGDDAAQQGEQQGQEGG